MALLALMALAAGVAYAAVSAYWALGGRELLDTVGGTLARIGRSGGSAAVVGLWVVVAVKAVAAALVSGLGRAGRRHLVLTRRPPRPGRPRPR
ncbi:MAG: DUF3995 domain-containing protein [Solirubrobacterales bacterium]|nr:DUF3995 domain-containing protein [Solirubrobacterales bacterium]